MPSSLSRCAIAVFLVASCSPVQVPSSLALAPVDSAVVVPKASATPRSPLAPAEKVVQPGCAPGISADDAERALVEAQRFIERAGEHPSDSDWKEILPRLKQAALSGHLNAQARYGSYVVGYWMTDEMFWPKERATAVSALAMLRVAVRRGHPSVQESWSGLGSSPPVRDSEVFKNIPDAWLAAAVSEGDAWERCHP